ncbi:cytidylate kinase [Bacillus sp. M6-12]|uniref:(d)CMP kinase n=1 Tax=Bacillus sp. M6-12 TaxID=2054166 RepID=UPI000C79055A|nr:(d)CMP kinase [Bacillus sp. M6-12]PLS16367.1 cytidylate kinase [Bacillus sp. M6-12]
MEKKISIAIDGPAAAGKSTVAKIVAEKLTYIYVDTGAMYRALTYKALKNEISIADEDALASLLEQTTIELKTGETGQKVFLDGDDVTSEIRNNQVTASVSEVAAHQCVREELVRRQQIMAQSGGIVMDGRDIGTHVLPTAEVKVFLIASVDERAERRHLENCKKGFASDLAKLKEEISQRDKWDSERAVSPLRKAEDAVEIDTTCLSIQQVAEKIMQLVTERTR